jgi:hypothetical protein
MDVNAPVTLLINRLHHARQIRQDRWIAKCPAHDDRSPSLSISETSDGTVLIRCWAGCGAEDIVNAVGLRLGDLFPRQFTSIRTHSHKNRFNAYEVVKTACSESMILCLAYQQVLSGTPVSPEDEKRIDQAIHAITAIHREVLR